ncbi:alcohol dehydrogenase catalytic domain-containing protein [Kribbella sp. NPDC006257]|uniref:alcohol dehydrogenase catalytic domain-containing protein n=1 Tax=Kribbella sp. NPDC006257 TaxID=3156738 RepID=UPI0033BE3B3F
MRIVTQDTLGGPEVLRVTEAPRPEPGPTEVLVRVKAAGINPVDLKVRRSGGFGAQPPFTIGWDVAGVVEKTGYGATGLREGDEVLGMPWFPRPARAYAEYVTAPSRHFVRKPAGMSFTEAAALPLAGLTGWQSLFDIADLQPGQRVLVGAHSDLRWLPSIKQGGQLKVRVAHTFALGQVVDAHQLIESGRAHGKVVLIVDPD